MTETDFDRVRVGLEAFRFREGDDGVSDAFQAFPGEGLDGHFPEIAVHTDAAAGTGPAGGGEGVVGAGGVVAGALRAVGADEDAAGGGDGFADAPGVVHRDDDCGFSVGIMWPGTISVSSKAFPAGGTAMFALLAMAGDLGGSIGPAIVGRVTQFAGDDIRAGMGVGLIFPIVLIVMLVIMGKKRQG